MGCYSRGPAYLKHLEKNTWSNDKLVLYAGGFFTRKSAPATRIRVQLRRARRSTHRSLVERLDFDTDERSGFIRLVKGYTWSRMVFAKHSPFACMKMHLPVSDPSRRCQATAIIKVVSVCEKFLRSLRNGLAIRSTNGCSLLP
jgi:hypothetical protein